VGAYGADIDTRTLRRKKRERKKMKRELACFWCGYEKKIN